MIERLSETIVAISSPPGCAAVGILRLSGPRARTISSALADDTAAELMAASEGGVRLEGRSRLSDELTVPATFLIFKGPKSYTREDVVEIHTVGSPRVLEMMQERAVTQGAIPATPGEFTARAFLHGGLELSGAEAVANVIHAESDSQLRAARRMMAGSLTQDVRRLRDELAELVALVEADIDFAEEPIDFITPDALRERAAVAGETLSRLAEGGPTIERLGQLPHVLLLGPPNAGKSSLMNRLTGIDRAICSAVAGTTRDILAAPMELPQGEAILLDAAGIDQSDDPIIARARTNALLAAQHVDLVCLVVDVTTVTTETVPALTAGLDLPKTLIVANKCDLGGIRGVERSSTIPVSALTGEGVDCLREAIYTALGSRVGTVAADHATLTGRQREAILDAVASLNRATDLATEAAATIDCADLLAFELRAALDALGRVTGEVTTEDLLAHVFANFCIGK